MMESLMETCDSNISCEWSTVGSFRPQINLYPISGSQVCFPTIIAEIIRQRKVPQRLAPPKFPTDGSSE